MFLLGLHYEEQKRCVQKVTSTLQGEDITPCSERELGMNVIIESTKAAFEILCGSNIRLRSRPCEGISF
jgi:hypothetical protein